MHALPVPLIQHGLEGICADGFHVPRVYLIHRARGDAALGGGDLRRAEDVDHRPGAAARVVGGRAAALGAAPVLPEDVVRVEENELQPLLHTQEGNGLVEGLAEGIEGASAVRTEVRSHEEDGGELALLRSAHKCHLGPKFHVHIVCEGRIGDGILHTPRGEARAVCGYGEGAHLGVADHRFHPRLAHPEHLRERWRAGPGARLGARRAEEVRRRAQGARGGRREYEHGAGWSELPRGHGVGVDHLSERVRA
mmetsp:Transcript_11357/g.33674  ORF Transcript_11357/g.33674 Transcript_11357/m.33674 type:complete len:252 (-) Transcript_11357:263-1018(-)